MSVSKVGEGLALAGVADASRGKSQGDFQMNAKVKVDESGAGRRFFRSAGSTETMTFLSMSSSGRFAPSSDFERAVSSYRQRTQS